MQPQDPLTSPSAHNTKRGGAFIEHEHSASVFSFSPAPAKRRRAALRRGLIAAALTTSVLAIILAPDYLANYAGRGAKEQALFGVSLLGVGALIGFALMISRLATRERWILDASRGELVCERRLFGLTPRQEALELGQVKELLVVDGEALKARLEDGYVLDLLHEDFSTTHGQAFLKELSLFCKTHHLELDPGR